VPQDQLDFSNPHTPSWRSTNLRRVATHRRTENVIASSVDRWREMRAVHVVKRRNGESDASARDKGLLSSGG
jgi:hypothetical protein